MIQINDNDLPITVAKKIITGTKAFTGDDNAGNTQDMFDLEEIKEIAEDLIIYHYAHKNGD